VTLTDSAGCSVSETYTGAMSICAGSPDAAATQIVHVTSDAVAPPVVPPTPTPTTPTATTSLPAPSSPPADPPAPPVTPEALVVPRSLKGTPTVSGSNVRLAWTPAPGAPPSKRYLIAWSPLHSAQGPSDPLMHHVWTSDTQLLMSGARPGMTLHYAVYAYGSDGVLTRAGKTTIRLPR
jgi:hypothetical protein